MGRVQIKKIQRNLWLFAEEIDEEDTVIVPFELLDDEVGDDATDDEHRRWVESNFDKIIEAYEAKKKDNPVSSPFNRIRVDP